MERLHKGRYGGDGTDQRRRAKSSAMKDQNPHRDLIYCINGNKARKEKKKIIEKYFTASFSTFSMLNVSDSKII